MRLLEKSAITFVLIFITNVVGFLINVLLARIMPTLEFGKLQTAYGITVLIFNLINLGLVNATTQHIIQNKSKKKETVNYIFNGFILVLFVALVFLGLIFIFLNPIMEIANFNTELLPVIRLSLFLVLLNLIYYFLTTSLISSGEVLKNTGSEIVNILLYGLGSVALFFISGLVVENVILVRLISFLIPSIIILFYFFYKKKIKFSLSKIKEIIITARVTFLIALTTLISGNLVKPIMGLISFEQVAYYSVAMNYGQIILVMQSAIKTILFSRIGVMAAAKKIKELKNGLAILFDVVIKLVFPLSLVLIILASDIILFIYSEKYIPSIILVIPIIIGAIINMLSINDAAIFYGLSKLKEFNKFNFLKSLFYLPALLFLVIVFQAMGASLGFLVLSIISLILFLYYMNKFNIKISLDKPMSILFPCLILLFFFLTNNKIISIIFIGIYVLLAVKYNIVSKQTKDQIIKALNSRGLKKISLLFT